jgi:hypothetical protein
MQLPVPVDEKGRLFCTMPQIYGFHSTGTGLGWELTAEAGSPTAALLCGTLGLQRNEVVRGATPSGLEAQGHGDAGGLPLSRRSLILGSAAMSRP